MKKIMSLTTNHWSLIAIIIIVIIASFLRLYNITELPPGFYPDEAIYANNGIEAWETNPLIDGLKIFYPENNGREGLWPNIIGFFILKLGNEPWVPRSVAAIFGILTILGAYLLTKELFRNNFKKQEKNEFIEKNWSVFYLCKNFPLNGENIALLASFLMATSFWHILFSRIGFRAIMAPFFLTWGVYFLLKSLNLTLTPNIQKLKLIFFSASAGIFYGLGFHTYIAYRATPLLILIILILYWLKNKEIEIRKKLLLSASCFFIFSFIVAAPLGLYFLKNPQDFLGRTTQISVFNSLTPIKDLSVNILKTAGMFNFSGDYNWRHNYAGKPELFWPIGILFIIGIFLGIKSISKKSDSEKKPFLILFAWLIITALPVIISNEGQPHALRAILMAPAIFILAGFSGIWLIEKIKNQISKIKNASQIKIKILNSIICASFIIIFSFLVFEAYDAYFIKWGQNQNTQGAFNADFVKIGRELNSFPKETPKYVIVEAGGVNVRGLPMPAQTVMFITDTFTPEKQKEKNIFYILPEERNQIPENAYKIILK